MLERDDQDLAVEQLSPADRADDRQLTLALDHTLEPLQEHAAARAEPAMPGPSRSRLRDLGDRIDQLMAQRAALPTSQLSQLDAAQAQMLELTERRDGFAASLERLPAPKCNLLGRECDEHILDRTRA